MSVFWSHPVLTKGANVAIPRFNLTTEKARLALKLEHIKRGIDGTELAGVEMLECVSYHTLRRAIPGLTLEDVAEHLDALSARTLGECIAEANRTDAPKAESPQLAGA